MTNISSPEPQTVNCFKCSGKGRFHSLYGGGRRCFVCNGRGYLVETPKMVANRLARAAREVEAAAKVESADDPRIVALKAALQAGIVPSRSVSFAQDLVAKWARYGLSDKQWVWVEKLSQPPAPVDPEASVSRPVGTLGQRLDLTLTVESTREVNSQWGASLLVKTHDASGNRVAFFVPLHVQFNSRPGATLIVRGTVKGHREFAGQTETTINRVDIKAPSQAAA